MNVCLTLAQAASQPTQPPAPGAGAALRTFLPVLAMIAVFYWLMMRGSRREQKKVQDMLRNLKRNDRVQTIGGIRGTVVDVRDDEVVVKVDEASNVRMRFARNAIKEVFADKPAEPVRK